jgi:hypothetical protein
LVLVVFLYLRKKYFVWFPIVDPLQGIPLFGCCSFATILEPLRGMQSKISNN